MTPSQLPTSPDAHDVARSLLAADCVQVRTDEPFRLPSGWASPVYMNCRKLISFPEIRKKIVRQALSLLEERRCLQGLTAITGAEASGIAIAAWIADALDLPLQYVRKQTKGIGPDSQIVGVIRPGEHVLLVDDLMAGGHSKYNCCRALLGSGATLKDIFVIFDYGAFPTKSFLDAMNIRLHALATWHDILAVARADACFGTRELNELETFLADPVRWSYDHGGISSVQIDTKGIL